MTKRAGWWTVLLAACLPGSAEESGGTTVYRGHGMAMHGALKYAPDFTHFEYVDPHAPKGGTLRLAAIGGFDSFNGFILRGTSAGGLGWIYESLLTSSRDEAFSGYGLLAESMEVPEDRSWVIFNLRPEARWHDGLPVTADDVVFTFNLLIEKGHPQYRFYYGSVEKVEKLGERRVKFSFKAERANRELPLIMGQLSILPKHYWEQRDFTQTTLDPPLGSGPYRVDTFEANRFVSYRRVPDYWGAKLPVMAGMNNYDRIKIDYYRDQTVIMEAFKAGELDYRAENNSKDWATAYDLPAVRGGVMRKEELPHQRTAGMQGYVFNMRRRLFQDRRTREALAQALDFEWTNKKLFYGAYTRCRSYFGNSELEAAGLPAGEQLEILRSLKKAFPESVPDEVFEKAYAPPTTGEWDTEREHKAALRTNLRTASRLLKEAGWRIREEDKKLVHDEYRNDQGELEPFAFEILLGSPAFERITLPYSRNLNRLGIEARVRTVDTAQYQKRVEDFDYDVVVNSWGQSLSPGNEQRSYWSSASADTRGSMNLAGIRNPAIDRAVEYVIEAPDRESLVQRTRALDALLQWGHYVVPHWYVGVDRVAYWDKFGRPDVIPMLGSDVMTWWIDPEKAASLEQRRKALKN